MTSTPFTIDRLPRRVAVTGASGFIGSCLTRLLANKGCEVHGIGRSAMADEDRAALALSHWSSGGITVGSLAEACEGVEVIYHCAGSASVPLSLREPMTDFQGNVVTTLEVLEFARHVGRLPVVLLSSAGVYGRVGELPIRTASPCNPVSPYGVNKQVGELLAQQYARHFGVPVIIIRLFSVYGSGLRKQLLWDASHKLHRGEMQFFGTGEETRDWIHVQDAAALIAISWAHASEAAPVVNGASGHGITIRRVLETLAQSYNINSELRFSGDIRPGDPAHYVADISEAQAMGWMPAIPFERGVADYASWFRKMVLNSALPEFNALGKL